ncbi:Uncharacterised protein [Sarcina ventriculi]|uniref:helix-turn-helix domain-containing protein n=1 Tax=Sarcina ventriculi TaxID=1267 RepID=UPI000D94AF6C|nr:helix-turn-helix domain-containing protein [Sarcina ventriculi]SPZ51070.1 Uncharacterised protein [Sarcina ventriculi]
MKITKDFLKFKQFLRNKKLKPVQKVIMEYLFELHNCKFGYAFPSMKDLVMEVNASCNNTVISAIKKLEKMGLLKVNRKNKNNRYYIEDIENFLVGIKKNTSTEKEFSDKKTVCSFNEDNINCEIDEIMLENKIARDMNCSLEEAVNALKYAKERKAKSLIAYAKSSIKNGWHKIQNSYSSTMSNINKKVGFANFTQRVYDYEKLERQLLGWD